VDLPLVPGASVLSLSQLSTCATLYRKQDTTNKQK